MINAIASLVLVGLGAFIIFLAGMSQEEKSFTTAKGAALFGSLLLLLGWLVR